MSILHWLVVLKSTKKIFNCKTKPINLTFTCSKDPNQQKRKTSTKSFKDFTLLTTPNQKKPNQMKPLCQKKEIYLGLACLNTSLTIIETMPTLLNPLPKNFSNSGKIPMKEKSMEFSGMMKLLKKTFRFS
jgi:hypothetical protein